MARKAQLCSSCGKYRVGITVVDGRDLCPECVAVSGRLVAQEATRHLKCTLDGLIEAYTIGRADGIAYALERRLGPVPAPAARR